MPEPAQALRLGDHVHYDGQSWQPVTVNGMWLTVRGSSMQSCAVLLTQLVEAPDFAVLDTAVPVVPVRSAALTATAVPDATSRSLPAEPTAGQRGYPAAAPSATKRFIR